MLSIIIFLAIAIILLIVGSLNYSNTKKIIKEGIETEGIIFDTKGSDLSNIQLSYPVVRFLTDKNEWITETANIGLIPGLYKKGKKVTIIYLQSDPKQFIIKNNYNNTLSAILIIVGLIFLAIGLRSLLRI